MQAKKDVRFDLVYDLADLLELQILIGVSSQIDGRTSLFENLLQLFSKPESYVLLSNPEPTSAGILTAVTSVDENDFAIKPGFQANSHEANSSRDSRIDLV